MGQLSRGKCIARAVLGNEAEHLFGTMQRIGTRVGFVYRLPERPKVVGVTGGVEGAEQGSL